MKKFDPSTGSAALTLGVVLLVGLLLSLGTVFPPGRGSGGSNVDAGPAADADDLAFDDAVADDGAVDAAVGGGNSGTGSASSGDGRARTGGGTTAGSGGGGGGGGGGRATACNVSGNGGSTDVGVTSNRIKLAATIVNDGPGASFLAPVRIGMNAVVNKVNGAGGICGRRIELILRNDSWSAERGQQFIQNFVESEKVFALAVVPSSEGLRAADKYVERQQVPVVGSDGMLIHQYRNPWIWPVATSTISTMHIMARNAYDRGARHFGIVFDSLYHFGVEGAYAYNQAVKRMTGSDIPGYDASLKSCNGRFCGIQPNKSTYNSEAQQFYEACGMTQTTGSATPCDFIAVLLEPDTALSWFGAGTRSANPRYGFGGAQPLFTSDFAQKCRSTCDGMWVWTGYNPPIEQYAGAGPVTKYVADVRKESSSADVNNQFLEGGYIGMSLMVEALTKVGPNLTRANLKAVLDSMTYDSGLSSSLTWRPGNHFANASAQAYEIQYKQGFNGWRSQTPLLRDPWVGQDIPPGE